MPIAHIDMDIFVYQIASACNGTHWMYKGQRFNKKVELNAVLKADGVEDSEIERQIDPEPEATVAKTLRDKVDNTIRVLDTQDFLGYLSGKGNFRYKVATILPYKGNRSKVEKPHHYDFCRQFLTDTYRAEMSKGIEADDSIGLAMNMERGDVIATLDKDLDCIPGRHYNFNSGFYDVPLVDADRNFYKQLLIGDITDNIPGLFGVGKSSVLVKKLWKMETPEEMYRSVRAEYVKRFGSYAKQFLRENARLLWILQDRECLAIGESDYVRDINECSPL